MCVRERERKVQIVMGISDEGWMMMQTQVGRFGLLVIGASDEGGVRIYIVVGC